MPLRVRNGFWHYRFKMHGKPYSGTTGFEATVNAGKGLASGLELRPRTSPVAAAMTAIR